ncbi:MAG: branched chain amino acid aminotransferase, partial [Lactococcus raffinolactis]
MTLNIDWENLGFEYMNLPYRFIARFKDGQWD